MPKFAICAPILTLIIFSSSSSELYFEGLQYPVHEQTTKLLLNVALVDPALFFVIFSLEQSAKLYADFLAGKQKVCAF